MLIQDNISHQYSDVFGFSFAKLRTPCSLFTRLRLLFSQTSRVILLTGFRLA